MEKEYLQSREETFAEVERRIRSEGGEELVRITLSDADMEVDLFLERLPCKEGIHYMFALDIEKSNAELDVYFDGFIDDEVLARTYLNVDDLINGELEQDYIISSWGQLQLAMMNRNEKTMELLVFFDAENAEEGSGIYLRMELEETMTRHVRDSLLSAYKKNKKFMKICTK